MSAKQKLWVTPYDYMEIPTGRFTSAIATRERSGDFAGLLNWLPNPDPILRKMGRQIDAYENLTADPHLYSVRRQRSAAILKLQWDIKGDKADKRVTSFVEDFMEPLKGRGVIRAATAEMLGGMDYGYQPLEVMWERVGDYDLPVDIVGKPSRWFKFDTDSKLLFISRDNYNGELVPDMKFILARQHPSYANNYGESDLSRCFWPVSLTKGGVKWWTNFGEKYGMPWALGKYPKGTKDDQVAEMISQLDEMVQDAVGVFPDVMNVEIHQTGSTTSSEIYERFLAYCERQISKVYLGHSSVSEATPGKLGNDTMATEVRGDIVDDAKAMCEQSWNTLISWVVKHNFGEGVPAPLFRMFEEEDVDMELVQRDAMLTKDLGVEFTDDYISDTYKIDKKYFKVSVPKPPAPPAAGGLPGKLPTPDDPTAEEGAPPAFAEDAIPPDQKAVIALADGVTPEQLQAQMDELLQPVFDHLAGATSFSEALTELKKVYPAMSSADLQAVLRRQIFMSELIGRISADD